ncbi:hypothetical protein AAMO2058_001119300 [Amorphochlora amoebiformis]
MRCSNRCCKTTKSNRWREVKDRFSKSKSGKPVTKILCNLCYLFRSRKHTCPHCDQIYHQGDRDGFDGHKWLTCGDCVRMVHVHCEKAQGLADAEKIYRKNMCYTCPDCRREATTPDRQEDGETFKYSTHQVRNENSTPRTLTPSDTSSEGPGSLMDFSSLMLKAAAEADRLESSSNETTPSQSPVHAHSTELTAQSRTGGNVLASLANAVLPSVHEQMATPSAHQYARVSAVAPTSVLVHASAPAPASPPSPPSHSKSSPAPSNRHPKMEVTSSKSTALRGSCMEPNDHGEAKGLVLRSTSPSSSFTGISTQSNETRWIKCTGCAKWRKLKYRTPLNRIFSPFTCRDNFWDQTHADCRRPEEPLGPEERVIITHAVTPAYLKKKKDFYRRLSAFHLRQGKQMCRNPTLGGLDLDLCRLYQEVTARGGCKRVVAREGTWAAIFRTLENYSPTVTDASYRLRRYYNDFLYAFEQMDFFRIPFSEIENKIPSMTSRKRHRASYQMQQQAVTRVQASRYQTQTPVETACRIFDSYRPNMSSVVGLLGSEKTSGIQVHRRSKASVLSNMMKYQLQRAVRTQLSNCPKYTIACSRKRPKICA